MFPNKRYLGPGLLINNVNIAIPQQGPRRKFPPMPAKTLFHIAVLPGDGIGVDVTEEAIRVLRAVEKRLGAFTLKMNKYDCGAVCYQRTGNDLPPDTIIGCCQADAVLLGA